MCSQNAGNAISETHILEISWEDMPQTPVANSCLRYSAHTIGDRILSWGGGQGKWALWQFCPTTEESLKNALSFKHFLQILQNLEFHLCKIPTVITETLI
jgi:hypothetical protein